MRKLLIILACVIFTQVQSQVKTSVYFAPDEGGSLIPSTISDIDSTYGWYQAGTFSTDDDSVTVWPDATNDFDYVTEGFSPHFSADTITFTDVAHNLTTGDVLISPQSVFIYAIIRQDAFTSGRSVMFGGVNSRNLKQLSVSPRLSVFVGSWRYNNDDCTIGDWHVMRYFVDGSDSKLQIDAETATTTDVGGANQNGYGLGASDVDGASFSMYEMIIMHTDFNEDSIYNYLVDILPE